MKRKETIYAVIDTNVLVSSLFSSNGISNPAIVISSVLDGHIVPLYNEEIMSEYREVLSRDKFHFPSLLIENLLSAFTAFGINTDPSQVRNWEFPDEDDIIFYEVKMSVEDAYLVTGNIKHFPVSPFVVTPLQMVEILKEKGFI